MSYVSQNDPDKSGSFWYVGTCYNMVYMTEKNAKKDLFYWMLTLLFIVHTMRYLALVRPKVRLQEPCMDS